MAVRAMRANEPASSTVWRFSVMVQQVISAADQ